MKALDKNGERIKLFGCYHIHNSELGLNDIKMSHECFVIKISKNYKKTKVVTITSLEIYKPKSNQYLLKNRKLDDMKKGKIIPIPIKEINTPLYSGIFLKGIWVNSKNIEKSNKNYKFPIKYKKFFK